MRARAAVVLWMVAACGVNPAFDDAATVAATGVDPTTEVAPPGTSTTSDAAPTSGTTNSGVEATGDESTSTTMAVVSTSAGDEGATSGPGTTGTMDMGGTSTDDATTAAPVSDGCPEDDALIACYRFEEGPGNGPMLDDSGNGHHGGRSNAGSVASVEGFGSALDLSPGSDVHVQDSAAFASPALTVASFVYVQTTQPAQKNKGLIDRAGTYRLLFVDDNVQCELYTDLGPIQAALFVEPGRWYHVACTFADGQMRMYVHGGNTPPMSVAVDLAAGLLAPVGSEFIVGRVAGNDDTKLTGWIDQVMVFGRALSNQEVCSLAGPLC